ncbi:MAG: hypothetical protein V3U03_17455 [Myxococcota bacterium]
METTMNTRTDYTAKDLHREARAAIRNEARAAKVTARYCGWLLVLKHGNTTLVAEGQRADGFRFTVNIAI